MEKERGIRLHSVAPLPYFLWLLNDNDPSDGTRPVDAASSVPEDPSPADLSGFASIMDKLSKEAAASGTGAFPYPLAAGTGTKDTHTGLAVFTAGVLLLGAAFRAFSLRRRASRAGWDL